MREELITRGASNRHCPVHEARPMPNGDQYYVMKLVEDAPLTGG